MALPATIIDPATKEAFSRDTNNPASLYSPVINSSNLQATTPIVPTQPLPSTQSAGLDGAIGVQQDAFTKDLAAKETAAADAKKTAGDALIKSLMSSKGQSTLTDELYKTSVDPAQAELKDINQQILQEKESTRRRIEALQKNPNGLYGGALDAEVQKVQDDSTRRQADLSLIQLAKQGKFDSAKAIADRAVAAELEVEKNHNAALQLSYEDNKDLFSTAEQRQFQTAQKDRENAYQKKEDDLKAIKQLGLDYLKAGGDAGTAQRILSSPDLASATQLSGGIFKKAATGTEAERQDAHLQQYADVFVTGAKMADGTPLLDANGYLTPTAFKSAIHDFPDRAAFIKKFGYLIYRGTDGSSIPDSYGITPVEQKLVTGAI